MSVVIEAEEMRVVFEEVPRPVVVRGRAVKYPGEREALVRTAETGMAIRVPLKGRTDNAVRCRLLGQTKGSGYRQEERKGMNPREAVADRAKWLDSAKPGLADLVDPFHLDLGSSCAPCVLDYVFAEEAGELREGKGYAWACEHLGQEVHIARGESRLPWMSCGGSHPFADRNPMIAGFWVEEIAARRYPDVAIKAAHEETVHAKKRPRGSDAAKRERRHRHDNIIKCSTDARSR